MLKFMYFGADWCQPCKQMKPIIGELIEEHPDVEFVNVDIEEDFDAAAKFQVRGVPTVVVLEDDEVVARHVGAAPKPKLESLLSS